MSEPLKFKIDVDSLSKQLKEYAMEAAHDMRTGFANLAAVTHAHIVDMAQQELHSTRKQFLDNLTFEEIMPGVWVVSVLEEGLFIEEGIPPGTDMKTDKWLLKNAKMGKNGKYKIIPFKWTEARGQMTDKTKEQVDELKKILKAQKVSFKKLERNAKGDPRLGVLHDFNFGGKKPGKGNTPIFDRVQIRQIQIKNERTGLMKTKREITTFRTVSENQTGKWIHPGLKGKKYLDIAQEWAIRTWENEILPEILNKYK